MTTQDSKPAYSELEYTKAADRKRYPFYHFDIDHKIPPETRELLETYSHVPKDQQSKHVHEIRDRAFDIRAYPCTGLGSWLVPQLRRLENYPEILQRVKDGAIVLDVGTFIGHDLRRLTYDGAPSDKLYGVDIASHFDVGYDFFRDRDQFKGHFIEADFLSSTSPELAALKGKVDIVIVSQVLHQWDWENQVKAAQTLVTFTKPGSMIVGNQIGNLEARHAANPGVGTTTWRHNSESIGKFWDEVGQATGTKWEAQAWAKTFPEMGWDQADTKWMDHDTRVIEFVVKRTA